MDRKSPLGDTTVQKVAVYSDTAPLSVVQKNHSGSRQAQRRSYFFYTDTATASTTKEISDEDTLKRFKDIEKIVLPFLYNLSKSDEPYIHWPNRGPIIKAQIEKILKLTRG